MPIIFLLILIFLLLEYSLFTGFRVMLSWFLPGDTIPLAIVTELFLSGYFGFRLLKKQREESLKLLHHHPQAEVLLKSLSLMIAGVLLIIPGILTDILGLLIIKGPGRTILSRRMDRFNPTDGMFRFFYAGHRMNHKGNNASKSHPFAETAGYSKKSTEEIIDIEAEETQK